MVRGQMKEYDFAFSLGFCCTCSESLRAEGLQYSSAIFDWVGVSDVLQAPRIIASDFRDWFDRDLLDLWDVRIAGGFVTRVYRNRKTGIGFVHDFSNAEPIETHYEAARAKYDRRIARFRAQFVAARRILAVYLEVPKSGCAAAADIAEARRLLASKRPDAEIDLIYMYEDPSAEKWEIVSEGGGVTVVRADYRKFLDGRLMHLCRNDQLRACLRTLAHVEDRRTPEEKAKFAELKRNERKALLGNGSRFDMWLNKKMLRLFRNIEAYLESQKIMPADRPLWFDGDGK